MRNAGYSLKQFDQDCNNELKTKRKWTDGIIIFNHVLSIHCKSLMFSRPSNNAVVKRNVPKWRRSNRPRWEEVLDIKIMCQLLSNLFTDDTSVQTDEQVLYPRQLSRPQDQGPLRALNVHVEPIHAPERL